MGRFISVRSLRLLSVKYGRLRLLRSRNVPMIWQITDSTRDSVSNLLDFQYDSILNIKRPAARFRRRLQGVFLGQPRMTWPGKVLVPHAIAAVGVGV